MMRGGRRARRAAAVTTDSHEMRRLGSASTPATLGSASTPATLSWAVLRRLPRRLYKYLISLGFRPPRAANSSFFGAASVLFARLRQSVRQARNARCRFRCLRRRKIVKRKHVSGWSACLPCVLAWLLVAGCSVDGWTRWVDGWDRSSFGGKLISWFAMVPSSHASASTLGF